MGSVSSCYFKCKHNNTPESSAHVKITALFLFGNDSVLPESRKPEIELRISGLEVVC